MNTVLFFVTVVATFGGLAIISRLFGKEGIFAWLGIAVVVANILVGKCVDLFGLSATLGNVLFGSVFLATDILTERYGVEAAKKAVWVGVASEIASLVLIQIALAFTPNSLDMMNESMHNVFAFYPRMTVASLSMFILSNRLDIFLFEKLREKTNGKHLWLRNNVATGISQCIENFLLYIIAFAGIYSMGDIIEMTLTCCLIELIVAVCDTPFIYWATMKKEILLKEVC